MAIVQSNIVFDQNSDAGFRVWGAAVSAALAAVGLVKTADTGQADWTSSATVRAAGNSQTTPYEIWRFTDALQATRPVFIRIGYGSGSGNFNPMLWITVGSSTNGAGTILGVSTSVRSTYSNVTPQTYTQPCYFSSDGSYLTMALAAGPPSPGSIIVLAIDRTRNADGTPNGDGLYCVLGNSAQSPGTNTLTWTSGVSARAWSGGTNAAFPVDTYSGNSGLAGLEISTYPHPVYAPKLEPGPASALLGMWQSDIANGTVFPVTHLGATHNFIAMSGYAIYFGYYYANQGVGNGAHSVGLRYE